ncbi:hypothetical protein AC578_10991 [Pseudocercospora eumusae]|uniref:Zinc finger PHD-type domain-containing protein n=1 Tax=Pseudocercospora eumusae TaxID=321146 RepID=A0A139HSF4_9PEZI|nr:hypothetical protein AC578_10991 [Pseudocercospora eumusae]
MASCSGYDGAFIKPEPMDEDVEMQDELFVAEESVTHAEAAQSGRPLDSAGNPFPTTCNTRDYRGHPYKHRLICGHIICTAEVEPCGSNCELSRAAESKPKTSPFECLHPKCIASRNAFIPKKFKKRACELSHIYGINEQEDRARTEEKAANASRGRQAVRPDQRALLRKNSISPDRRQRTTRKSTRQATAISTATEINAGLDAAERQLLKAQGGKHTRRVRGDRLETEEETRTDLTQAQAERSLEGMAIGTPRPKKKGRSQNISTMQGPVLLDRTVDVRDRDDCDGCGGTIKDTWFHCLNCADGHGQLGFDLCEDCHEKRDALTFVSRSHRQEHRFQKTWRRRDSDGPEVSMHPRTTENQVLDFELEEKWCICKSNINDNMLDCEKCQKAFHLGCVGEGFHTEAQYRMENAEEYHEADYARVRKEGITTFLCLDCKRGDEAAAQAMQTALDELRRAKAMVEKEAPENKQRTQTKRTADDAEIDEEEKECSRTNDMFGEEHDAVEHPAKCAKTGATVPTFGLMDLPFHGKK